MPLDLNEIEAAVLALPPEQRGHMAKRLLWSLEDAVETTVSPESESAWAEMAERRYQAYLAGEVRAVPADEALARIRGSAPPVRVSELEAALLALHPEQRGTLAERLLAGLEDECGLEDPEAVERAWIEEAERRYQEYLLGGVEVIPASEALAQVRAELSRP